MHKLIERQHIQALLDALQGAGYQVIAPTVQDGAIVYDAIESADELPIGWTDEQDKGSYRLTRRADAALFGYTLSPHSWKQYLLPPSVTLWQAQRHNGTFSVQAQPNTPPRRALLGVRPCELHAIQIQDRVFLEGAVIDPIYQANRQAVFIVAVNCTQAGTMCFCASMHTGPCATAGFDLALTECIEGDSHYFLTEIGSERGSQIMAQVPHRDATEDELRRVQDALNAAQTQMGRSLDTDNLPKLLLRNIDNPRWDAIANRCLTCGNCTQVCPTCFCTTVEDLTDLSGAQAERRRVWDSCYTMDFSYIHGGSVRYSTKARYRQWLLHKLATWVDQFGSFGCVGCGRCITWCPVGIDLTEEARLIREQDLKKTS